MVSCRTCTFVLTICDKVPHFNTGEKLKRQRAVRDRIGSWKFIESWSDELFQNQFRMERELFFPVCERMKANYPGRSKNGVENYNLSLKRGAAATPDSGPITMEMKLAITLRI